MTRLKPTGDSTEGRFNGEAGTLEFAPSPAAAGSEPSPAIVLSVVVPVFNEELNLPALFGRLYAVLDGLGYFYEIVFTNDGSTDGSMDLLRAQHGRRPDVTRVIDFSRNHGQHLAIMAAFERVRGEVVVTLDADLQNPPEEIPRLFALIAAGNDYVGGVRAARKDSAFRRQASRLVNAVRGRITNIAMTDHGCMLRAYRRQVIDAIVRSGATNTFIPALAYTFAARPVEVEVRHDERAAGTSKYSFLKLTRLNFDLITGFSLAPLQYFTLVGMASVAASIVLVLLLAGRWLLIRPPDGALFTLLGMVTFLLSVTMLGLGLIGEYAGRAYHAVRMRQRYHVREILEATR